MIPIVLLLCFIGSYTANNDIGDLIVLIGFGVVGYFMVKYRFPRLPSFWDSSWADLPKCISILL